MSLEKASQGKQRRDTYYRPRQLAPSLAKCLAQYKQQGGQ